jgi:spore coat polysaccharide biosynthesis protein SpsF
MPRTVATIEARMTSSRLPGKVLAKADGTPMLELMIERLRFAPELDEIVIATTSNATDDDIEVLARRLGVGIWRGSEEDVLVRVLDAATAYKADAIVELTGDCPLLDPVLVSETIQHYRTAGVDYVSNGRTPGYPMGMGVQVFAAEVLRDVAARTDDPVDHEHVSLYIYRHPEIYSLSGVDAPKEHARPDMRLTLDTSEDLAVIRAVFAALRPKRRDFSLSEIIAFIDAHPEIAAINAAVVQRRV